MILWSALLKEEFLDPLMQEIMVDPVRLPSDNVMERDTIERHILASDNDPFTREALTKDDLVPMPELKEKIRAFCLEHKIPYAG